MRFSAVAGGTKIQTDIELNSKAVLQSSEFVFFFSDKKLLRQILNLSFTNNNKLEL